MTVMHSFTLPLVKIDEERRLVIARAAHETLDRSNEILDYATAKPAFQKWSDEFSAATNGLSKGNVRSMHNPKQAAGRVEQISYNDDEKAIDVVMKIVDDQDWKKCLDGVFTGVSVGGGYGRRWTDEQGHKRYTPVVGEISLVDRPCIPTAMFAELVKADGTVEQIPLHGASFADRWATRPQSFAEQWELQKSTRSDAATGAVVGGALGIHGGAKRVVMGAAIGGAVGAGFGAVKSLFGGSPHKPCSHCGGTGKERSPAAPTA